MNLLKTTARNTPWLPTSFDDFFHNDWVLNTTSSVPAVNVQELEKSFQLELATPGLKKEDLSIELDNDVLSIASSSAQDKERKEGTFTQREFGYHSFRRSFSIPETVDVQKIKATYADGILTLNLPKRKEALPQPVKQITIG